MKHRNEWVPAAVSYKHHAPRSYVVETESGRKYCRNRRHLNLSKAPREQEFEATFGQFKSGTVVPEQTEITLPPTNVQRETAKPVASAEDPITVTRSGRPHHT